MKLLSTFYIMLLAMMMLGTQSFFSIPPGISEVMALVYIVCTSSVNQWVFQIERNRHNRFYLRLFVVPFCVIWGYSMAIHLISGMRMEYLQTTTTMCVRFVLYVMVGAMSVNLFREKVAKYIVCICAAVYIPVIFEFFNSNGLVNGILFLFLSDAVHATVALEVHTLTYIAGFTTVYFLYRWWMCRKREGKWFVLSLAITMMGLKRIVYLALLIVCLMILLLRNQKAKKRLKWVCLLSAGMVFVAILYVGLISSGILNNLFHYIGIQDNARLEFWNYFSDRYNMSPLFLGHGLSFAHRAIIFEWQHVGVQGNVTNIHNDVLAFYMGIGFVGSVLYWRLFFGKRVKYLARNCSVHSACFSFVISLFYFICMMFCNEGLAPFPHSIYFSVMYIAAVTWEDDAVNLTAKTER